MTAPSKDSCLSSVEFGEELLAFPTLFGRQVELTPERVAVVHEDRVLTYQDLDDLVDRYANHLSKLGICQGSFVGLCLDRSPEAIAAMIGVLACGGAFVPLDPEYPIDRLAYMVDDAKIDVIIADPTYRKLLSDGLPKTNQIRWIQSVPETADHSSQDLSTTLEHEVASDDLAYVMYTSGSTGKPKGVEIDHAALATYCFADIDVYQVVPDDRTLQFSTLNFDIAIEEIFPPLLTGSAIVVRPLGRSSEHNELFGYRPKARRDGDSPCYSLLAPVGRLDGRLESIECQVRSD